MRTPTLTAIALVPLALLTHATSGGAGPKLAASEDNGSISVKDGETIVAAFAPKTSKTRRAPATVSEVTTAGHALIEVRIPVQGEGPRREEVWIAERTSKGVKVIWWNLAGAVDIDGETSIVVKASAQGIEEYQTAARLSRCDGAPVALLRRNWDFASQSFRAAGPDLPARAAVAVQARRGNAPEGKPLAGFFFAAASSSPTAAGQPARLRPPAAVNDGDPATVWSTDGSGRGQLLTARSSSGFPITGLRLLPGDTRGEKDYRASAKPKRLTLIFGRDPGQNVEVELVEDANAGVRRFRQPFWVPLPKPVTSSCVTVLVREVTSEKTAMSIADIDVLTDLDGPEAADRLVSSLAQGISCEARRPLLARLGSPALAKVSAAIAKATPGTGRECLVEALDGLVATGLAPTPTTAAALVAALEHSTEGEEKTILKLLPGLADAPVEAVTALLLDGKRADGDRARAARVLAALDKPSARNNLLAAVGRGSPPLRKALRSTIAQCRAPMLPAALTALDGTPPADSGRRADFLSIIGSLAEREPDARPAALAALRAALDGAASFEERARAISGLGLVHQPAAVDALVAVRANNGDGVLRGLAISELANAEGPTALLALRAALDDADPQVREIAVTELGRRGDRDSAQRIVAGAKQEPWPLVRRAEISALGGLCTPEGNELLARAFQRDAEDVRQAALTGLARCHQAKATGTLLRTLGRLPESADMRSLAARLLAERKEPRIVASLAEVLARLVTESQADMSLEAVVADTAMALATTPTEPAVAALTTLLADPRASVQRIAVDALGVVCDPGAGAAALRAAARSKDESVSIRAAAAGAHCRERR